MAKTIGKLIWGIAILTFMIGWDTPSELQHFVLHWSILIRYEVVNNTTELEFNTSYYIKVFLFATKWWMRMPD